MIAIWDGLLGNLGVIAIFIALWAAFRQRAREKPRAIEITIAALLISAAIVATMSLPFEVSDGIIVDLRASVIVIGGFFGGAVVGLAAAATAAIYRLLLGGAGAIPGLAGIASVCAAGIVGNILVGGHPSSARSVIAMAAAGTLVSFTGFFLLSPDVLWPTLGKAGAPMALVGFTTMILAGLSLLNETSRFEAERSNRLHRAVIEALPDPLNAKDLDGRFLAANPATAKLMGADSAEALIGRTDFDFYPDQVARQFREEEFLALQRDGPIEIEQDLSEAFGEPKWLLTMKAPLRDRTGRLIGMITHNRDITERNRLRADLEESRQRLADAMATMADGLVVFDKHDRLVFCNEQYRALFPQTARLRVPGANFADILRASAASDEKADRSPVEVEQWVAGRIASLRQASESEIQLADGRWLNARVRPTADGGSLTVISDITRIKRTSLELTEANQKLSLLASTDGLTGLANRRAFDAALMREISRSARANHELSVILIDVDRFKSFNDTYGHPAGDECLRAVAFCLKAATRRPTDLVARYGGEEMAALLPDTDEAGAVRIAETFVGALRELGIRHEASEKGIVTASVGVACSRGLKGPQAGANLLRRADEALYAAKASGRNAVRTWQGIPRPCRWSATPDAFRQSREEMKKARLQAGPFRSSWGAGRD
ncbi:MAG TPA: diguanylate cyclase [Bauldia sp.]|nr:diguanylate cyclase [Bauldia sp.]